MGRKKRPEPGAGSDHDREATELWQQILRDERRHHGTWREIFETAEAAVGAKVRALRVERGWSQGDLADKLDEVGWPIHQTNISKLEAGRRPIRVAELHALAAVFGLPPIALWYLPVPGEPWSLARMRQELEQMDERVARSEEYLRTAVRMYADHQFERERLVLAMNEASAKADRGELEQLAMTPEEVSALTGGLDEARTDGGAFPVGAIRAAVALQAKASMTAVTAGDLARITSGLVPEAIDKVIAIVAGVALEDRDSTVLRHIRGVGLERLAAEGLAAEWHQRAMRDDEGEEMNKFLSSLSPFAYQSTLEEVEEYIKPGEDLDMLELAQIVAAKMTPEELASFIPVLEDRSAAGEPGEDGA